MISHTGHLERHQFSNFIFNLTWQKIIMFKSDFKTQQIVPLFIKFTIKFTTPQSKHKVKEGCCFTVDKGCDQKNFEENVKNEIC